MGDDDKTPTDPTMRLAAEARAAVEKNAEEKKADEKVVPYKEPPWQERMCPILSVGAFAGPAKDQRLVIGMAEHVAGGTPQGAEVVMCQGSACMFFMPILNEKGVLVSGGCAVGQIPLTFAHMGNAIGGMLNVLAHRARLYKGEGDRG